MTAWRVLSADRRVTYCPVALELRDEFTAAPAFGRLSLSLDLQRGARWIPTELEPVKSPGGVFLYTGLGRALDPGALPLFRVRVRIEADCYRPAYRVTDDAIEIDVPSYNDAVAPVMSPLMPEVVLMLPTAAYPFGGHVRTMRGRVLDGGGTPLPDAIVQADGVERVITGADGSFTLPLRWQAENAAVNVAVDHPRSGLSAVPVFNLPGDLSGNHDITVT
jgi:hypothetical protein